MSVAFLEALSMALRLCIDNYKLITAWHDGDVPGTLFASVAFREGCKDGVRK